MKFLYPGHNYLGPGNKVDNGKPVNEADYIAQQHDIAYEKSRTKEDIYNADKEAIHGFYNDFKSSLSVPSFIGGAGLGIKHLVEKSIDKVIYPKLNAGNNQGEPPNKQPRVGDAPSETQEASLPSSSTGNGSGSAAMEVDDLNRGTGYSGNTANANPSIQMQNLSAAGGADGGNGAGSTGGLRGTAPLWSNNRQGSNKNIRVYKKQYHLRLVNTVVETQTLDAGSVSSNGAIRYPFHDIPVHNLGFYLSKAEIHELTRFTSAYVRNVKVDVYNKTGCLNFETASSISSIGNNNIGIYLCQLDENISKYRNGSLPSQSTIIEQRMWGTPYPPLGQTSGVFVQAPATLGSQYVRRTLDNRFEYNTVLTPENWDASIAGQPGVVATAKMAQPLFNPLEFVKMRKNVSFEEGLFTSWSYQPKDGLVAGQFTNTLGLSNRGGIPKVTYSNKRKMPLAEAVPATSGTNNRQLMGNVRGVGVETNGTAFDNEAGGMMRWQNFVQSMYSNLKIDDPSTGGAVRPPVLVIGIEPLVTEIQDRWEAVNAYVDITIETYCEIEICQGNGYTNSNTRSVILPDYMNPRLVNIQYNVGGYIYPTYVRDPETTLDVESFDSTNRQFQTVTEQPSEVEYSTTPATQTVEQATIRRSSRIKSNKERLDDLEQKVLLMRPPVVTQYAGKK